VLQQNNQSGFALIFFVLALLGMVGIFGSVFINNKVAAVNEAKTSHDNEVLRKAKQALLSYAVEYVNSVDLFDMGRLPCPDLVQNINPEGFEDGTCGVRHANSAGFLPWKTLGIDVLRDSDGECLWYVVSGDYKNGFTRANMLNEDSNGLLQVQDENGVAYHGANPGDRPIALIIAPGALSPGQARSPNVAGVQCPGNYIETNYLESAGGINYALNHTNVADQIWTYVFGSSNSRLTNSNFNDKIVWITKDEYWDAVKAVRPSDLDTTNPASSISQLTQSIAQCMVDYANDANNERRWLPWAAPIDLSEYRSDENNGAINEYIDFEPPGVGLNFTTMGRVPQNISATDLEETNPNPPGSSNPATPIATHPLKTDIFSSCLTGAENNLWQNWKDHFFYVIARDFEMKFGDQNALFTRCAGVGTCLTVNGTSANAALNVPNVAGIVFYSGSVTVGQSRNYDPVDLDEKDNLASYFETVAPNQSNAHGYPLDAAYVANGGNTSVYYGGIGDLVYCITINGANLQVTAC